MPLVLPDNNFIMASFPDPATVSEIANKIRFARPREEMLGGTVFLIGAGCSISAGIPGAIGIVKRRVREVARGLRGCDTNIDCDEAYKILTRINYSLVA